jgi:4-aminobutyrate aminotransferase-like enzyme
MKPQVQSMRLPSKTATSKVPTSVPPKSNSIGMLVSFVTAMSMAIMSGHANAAANKMDKVENMRVENVQMVEQRISDIEEKELPDIVENVSNLGHENKDVMNAIIKVVEDIENVITQCEENKLDTDAVEALNNVDVQLQMIRNMT